MRKKIVAGNWKMNFTPSEAKAFIAENKGKFDSNVVEVVVCVPFVSLHTVQAGLAGSNIKVGAQNMHFMEKGAYTGEISAQMLVDMGVPYVIIGHSERREYFAETDETVNLKTLAALANKLTPIVCVGESKDERLAEKTNEVLLKQLTAGLANLTPQNIADIVIAYEPIWAIGTGLTATNEQAEDACAFIRTFIVENFGQDAADKVRILYGGSVSPQNAAELFAMPNIDGGLVGGASIQPSFEQVIHFG
ncbi:MAG: triose-phosphate isomerase [Defluviitaleaceae bacterium]|nr:triose-phosphate isomerase [Defluviitaleaceae bacterium]